MEENARPVLRALRWAAMVMLALAVAAIILLVLRARREGNETALYQKGLIYLSSGDNAAALDYFRRALELAPDHRDAQLGIVRALTGQKEFGAALQELERAGELGLSEAEVALRRADVYSRRAIHRVQAEGDAVTMAFCDRIVAEELDPAIDLVVRYADRMPEPALAHTDLGNLYEQRSRLLRAKFALLLEARNVARDLNHDEEAAARANEADKMAPEVNAVQQMAIDAYARAMDLDPSLGAPRLGTARLVMGRFVPRSDWAKEVLTPMTPATPQEADERALLLARAETLEGNHDRALTYLREVYDEERDQFRLRLEEAGILVEAERWQEAVSIGAELIGLSPTDENVAYLYGRALLLKAQKADLTPDERRTVAHEAANCLRRIFAGDRGPSWPHARFALGEALRKAGQRQQAIATYKLVLRDLQNRLVSRIHMVQELREIHFRTSLALAEELRQSSPDAAGRYLAHAFGIFPERPEALALARLMQKDGLDGKVFLRLLLAHAAAIATAGDTERALAICREGLPGGDDTSLLRLLMARLLIQSGSYTDASEVYADLWQEFPHRHTYAYELIDLHVQLGHLEEARRVCEKLIEDDPRNTAAIERLVGVLARSGDVAGAQAVVEDAGKRLGAGAVRTLLLYLHLFEGRTEEAVVVARAHVAEYPTVPSAHSMLAELLWSTGRVEEAQSEFNRALELGPGQFFGYRRGLLDLAEGRTREALVLLRRAQRKFPNHPLALEALAVALQSEDKEPEAVEFLSEAIGHYGAMTDQQDALRWYLAVIWAGQGDGEAAAGQVRRIPDDSLGPIADRQALLRRFAAAPVQRRRAAALAVNAYHLFRRADCPRAAEQQLAVMARLMPNEPLPACWAAAHLERSGRSEEAAARYREVVQKHPGFTHGWLALSQVRVGRGETEEAIRVLEEALTNAVDAAAAAEFNLHLGDLYDRQGRTDNAEASYRAAMEHPASTALAANNLAYLLATRRGDPDAALPLARRALELAGRAPAILDTLGWIHLKKGDVPKAVALLEAARTGLPHNPAVRYHLGEAYRAASLPEKARDELREALSISRTFSEADEASAALAALGG